MELTIDRTTSRRSPAPARREGGTGERPATTDIAVLIRTAVLLTMVVASLFFIFSSGVEADSTPRETVLHVVEPGDTLWSLASRYTPAGGDVRVTVTLIRDINGLSGSSVAVGAALQVPAD